MKRVPLLGPGRGIIPNSSHLCHLGSTYRYRADDFVFTQDKTTPEQDEEYKKNFIAQIERIKKEVESTEIILCSGGQSYLQGMWPLLEMRAKIYNERVTKDPYRMGRRFARKK